MLRSYLKIALRNLWRHRLFSFINIFGLASGMTVCLLALIQVKGAFDYDTFHPNAERTYRVLTDVTRQDGETAAFASSPLPLADLLQHDYKAIERITRVHYGLPDEATAGAKTLSIHGAFVDSGFFDIFGFRLATGYPANALNTVVLTEAAAERFFGKQNPIGQTLTLGQAGQFTVTGVLQKPPYPSHLKFDLLASMATMPLLRQKQQLTNWSDETACYTYVQLKPGSSAEALQTALNATAKRVNNVYVASATKHYGFRYQSLANISPGREPLHNITAEPILPNLQSISLLALVVLLLAGFNYINLTLTQSLGRAREVGVRKAVGAMRGQLVGQFLAESTLVALLAFVLAYGQLKLISGLPTVQRLIAEVSQDGMQWLYFLAFVIVTGLIAGWVPARTLSRYQPAQVLRGRLNTQLFSGIGLRKALIVSQFAATLIAIIFLAVFYTQSLFMASADYGFARERILNVQLNKQPYEALATETARFAGVEQVAATSAEFGFSGGEVLFVSKRPNGDSVQTSAFSITPSLVNSLGLTLAAGQNLPAMSSDSTAHFVLINEEAVQALRLGSPAEAVGQTIWLNESTERQIAGVVQNFHHSTLLRRIQPVVLYSRPSEFRILSLKVAAGAEETVMATLERTWKRHNPHQSLEAYWYDEKLYEQHLHRDDQTFIGLLTGMALSIACLGLFGMVTYTTETRIKEVGIRKVMGATFGQIVAALSGEFVWLLLIATLVGVPVGFLAGQAFLQQYAYHITVGVSLLLGCSVLLLSIGALTIGWQTYRAASANPVKSLRTE
ncbi:ABC transporter permease [Nibrella viscosa]|uniref:ABC transporter permease n=1 Tax=Nibrella viscosa TaxID=1084524 RepID=A0ABP8KNW8_9BACT